MRKIKTEICLFIIQYLKGNAILAQLVTYLKFTADQVLYQDPVLPFCYVWSLLTNLNFL